MNGRRDFELNACDKNIEICPEAVMFIRCFQFFDHQI